MRRQVVTHQLAHGFAGFNGARGMVRLQQDVIQLKEARIKVGLSFEHIQRGRPKGAGLQRRNQRLFIDIRCARDVDAIPPDDL